MTIYEKIKTMSLDEMSQVLGMFIIFMTQMNEQANMDGKQITTLLNKWLKTEADK